MSDVLLLVPPDRQITRAIQQALDLAARRGQGLLAAVVLDADATLRLAGRMIDVGLLPEKITDQVSETLAREHRMRAEMVLADVAEQARARGLPCRTTIESGDPADVCRRLVAAGGISVAVVVTEKRSWIGRVLSGAEPLQPPALGGCELVLVEED
jgi:nucleotide-binding universal stress UspA family protein